MEDFVTGTGQHILVHDKDDCIGNCPIHRPSCNHMKSWPLHWRDDLGIFERIDPLGVGHPDPDCIDYIEKCYGIEVANSVSLHRCSSFFCGKSMRVNGFTKYFVTPNGGVYNNKLNIFLKPQENKNYLWVQLNENGIRKYKSIHRLVAEAYIPNPEQKRVVNHKDFNTFNNCVNNLEWMTDSENLYYSQIHGRRDNVSKALTFKNKERRKFNVNDIN